MSVLSKKICCMLQLAGVSLMLLCGCKRDEPCFESVSFEEETTTEEKSEETTTEDLDEKKAAETEKITVYICGEVVSPGVYEMEADSRIYQVIERAGGLTEKADPAGINQAEPVVDAQMIQVLSREEVLAAKESAENGQEDPPQGQSTEDGRVNLNTATAEQLMTLPGIGASKAELILSYREENGSFEDPKDIMKIQGIKEGVYNKIKDQIVTK